MVLVFQGPAFCGDEDTRPKFLSEFHYMYYALILFVVTIIVTIAVSLATVPPSYKQVGGVRGWWGLWLVGFVVGGVRSWWGLWLVGLVVGGVRGWWGLWLVGLGVGGACGWWG